MSCWCVEINRPCYNCESRDRFKRLSPNDKYLVQYFLKNHNNHATRKMIDQFEDRHKTIWTDFTYDDLIEGNENQNQASSKA